MMTQCRLPHSNRSRVSQVPVLLIPSLVISKLKDELRKKRGWRAPEPAPLVHHTRKLDARWQCKSFWRVKLN